LSMAYLAPERVGRVASISATGRSGLNGVGMRYAQRSGMLRFCSVEGANTDCLVLMADPNWNRGFYYDGVPPHNGMKLARRKFHRSGSRLLGITDKTEIATITYRSGPEWEQRFGRRMLSEQERDPDGHPGIPKLKPDFLIETYLDHQVSPFRLLRYTAELTSRGNVSA
jgi:homoserine acetyltransferase